ncbi:MAG: hypothetical protein KUG77_29135 [Nannocystaceae bacterium]|nr:hypothetical protein [Nannocystaceae bacterium]
MLSDPVELTTRSRDSYVGSCRHRIEKRSNDEAKVVVERLLADLQNLEALRGGRGRPEHLPMSWRHGSSLDRLAGT